ncbi:MAG TPA: sigma-70 family RNA polymerase sigma factor [Woeseiaceae bacterium]|nr:sigma-70 family RNA polymerase sigma factor [Woeseiaceae bacterium]
MAQPDLNELLHRSGRGDERAFRALYEAAAPKLMAIAVRMLNDRQQAEDVVQQTMIAAWRSGAEFDPARCQATTWLASITRYRSLDLLRKTRRQHDILRDDHHAILHVLGHDEPLNRSEPIPAETAGRLERCLGEISRDQAGCIQLAFLEGHTFAEIADKLDRSIGTVKSWVRRGLQKLRECVER